MARTTSAAVKAVLGKQYDTVNTPDLSAYIDLAAALVDDVAACDADGDAVLSSARLEIIERWMSAYYYLTLDPLYKSKSTLSASGSWDADVERVKNAAISADSSGCLSSILNGRASAGVTWLGQLTQEQTDWGDRNTGY